MIKIQVMREQTISVKKKLAKAVKQSICPCLPAGRLTQFAPYDWSVFNSLFQPAALVRLRLDSLRSLDVAHHLLGTRGKGEVIRLKKGKSYPAEANTKAIDNPLPLYRSMNSRQTSSELRKIIFPTKRKKVVEYF